jgi:hypothetical protein
VLSHFPSFRAAWAAAGIRLPHARWAPWTKPEEEYLVRTLGVLPTAEIAATLGRGEGAIYKRARRLGLHVGEAHGWPLQRVARRAGLSGSVLRGYVDRGELPVFKGAKHVYVDPGDLVVVEELDWQQVPADLERAALRSLRWRLVQVLAGRDWRAMRPHRPCPAQPTARCGPRRPGPRPPRPAAIGVGTWVRVAGPVPGLPQCANRVGRVQRVFWSTHPRQHGPAPQWRAMVVFSKEHRRRPGSDIVYSVPVAALQASAAPPDGVPSSGLGRRPAAGARPAHRAAPASARRSTRWHPN